MMISKLVVGDFDHLLFFSAAAEMSHSLMHFSVFAVGSVEYSTYCKNKEMHQVQKYVRDTYLAW